MPLLSTFLSHISQDPVGPSCDPSCSPLGDLKHGRAFNATVPWVYVLGLLFRRKLRNSDFIKFKALFFSCRKMSRVRHFRTAMAASWCCEGGRLIRPSIHSRHIDYEMAVPAAPISIPFIFIQGGGEKARAKGLLAGERQEESPPWSAFGVICPSDSQ